MLLKCIGKVGSMGFKCDLGFRLSISTPDP